MLSRTLFRTFKSWTQYQAERLCMSEQDYLAQRAQDKAGAYDTWRHRNEVKSKINFLLDHCSADEQKAYFKEFTTEDLTNYLLNELNNLSEAEISRIDEVKVTYSALPGVNQLIRLRKLFAATVAVSGHDLNIDEKVNVVAKSILEDKLKEIHWRKIDQSLSS